MVSRGKNPALYPGNMDRMSNRNPSTQLPQDELGILGSLLGSTLQRVECFGYNAGWETGGIVEQVALTLTAREPIQIHFRPVLFGEHVPSDCRIAVHRGGITQEPEQHDLDLARQIERTLNLASPFVVAEVQVFEQVGGRVDRAYIPGVGEFEGHNCGDKICYVLARDGRGLHISADSADSPEMTIGTQLPVLEKGIFALRKTLR
jgi:hypothetical protein